MLHSPHLYSSHHHHHLHFIIPNSCYLTSFSFSSLSILPFHLHILFITICNSTLCLFRPFAISVLRFLPSIPILPTAPCAREYCRLCPSDGRKRHSPFRAYVNPQNGIWKSGPEQESVWSESKKHASFTVVENSGRGNVAPRRDLGLHSAPPRKSGGFRNYKPLNWNPPSSGLWKLPVSLAVSLRRKEVTHVSWTINSLKTNINRNYTKKDSVRTAQKIHVAQVVKTDKLKLFKKIIACYDIYTKRVSAYCVQKLRVAFGKFANLPKATLSFVMSVRPHGTTRLPVHGFWLHLVLNFFFENL